MGLLKKKKEDEPGEPVVEEKIDEESKPAEPKKKPLIKS